MSYEILFKDEPGVVTYIVETFELTGQLIKLNNATDVSTDENVKRIWLPQADVLQIKEI